MADFVPQGDGPFDDFVKNLVAYINGHLTDFGLVAADMAAVNAALTVWNTAYPAVKPAEDAFHSAVTGKVTAHDVLETLVRALVQVIQAKGKAVADAAKTAAGVPIVDTTKTPVPPPTSRPVARVVVSGVREHKLVFVDENTPHSSAKPKGVHAIEINVKIGTTPPADESELHHLATVTKTRFTHDFDPADAGKTAYYWCRWVNSKGDPGPWGVMVSATITG